VVEDRGEGERGELFEPEFELEVVEPGDARIDIVVRESGREVFEEGTKRGGDRRFVEGNEDGVVNSADVAVDFHEEVSGKVLSIPGSEGIAETLTELGTSSLSEESHGHLAVTDVEVLCACAMPAEGLIGAEELLTVPTFGVFNGEWIQFVTISG
jgi:hypothetical protein